ncbi:MAG TPA: cyclic nucleotide-binding domain-containing protein [Spirochaetota bacterium]|nr:cyclic nucleotide-binding domain-containing protein [Spirochaetota bacterium]HPC40992.1 cyclic nucleotide-binding domain-containing protein [Spirochaetota bacterium]HQF08895.1 cyclic nucleotide-binding domain-containing protein [Spirochaetota bacterium]HQH97514.1 cyclic nucleotide-binding domain-containing protein [Spirochaetota bacterium]HQJ71025.1 cyclic nucleotide-binding domain-containing protein [Spirochaetota bacterium]
MSNGAGGPSGIITRTYKSGSIIYFEGDKSEYIYILKAGKVFLTTIKLDTGEEYKEEVRQGEFFGVKSALGKYPREDTAQTVGNTTVLVLTPADFERLVLKNANVVKKMLRVFSNQLRRIVKMERSVLGETEIVNPDAELFKIGEYYYKAGVVKHAQYAYKRYMEYYPDGEKAALAMKRIRGIDAGEPAPPDIGGHDAGPAPAPPKQAEADFSFDEPDQSKDKDMIDFDDSTHEDEAPSRGGAGSTSLSSEMDDFFADTKAPALDDFDVDVTMSDSPRDLNDAADTSFGRGNYPMALELYQKIISLNRTASPEDKKLYEKAHFDAGRCFIEMGKPKEALDLMSKVLRNFTGSPYLKPAIFHIGMIFESVNQKEKAITYYNKVLNMSPKDKLNGDALTKIKQLQGK